MGITGVVSRAVRHRSSYFLSLSLKLKYKTLSFFSGQQSCCLVLSIHPLYPVNPFFVRENFIIIRETQQCCEPCSVLKLVCPAPVPRISCCHFHNCSPDAGAHSGAEQSCSGLFSCPGNEVTQGTPNSWSPVQARLRAAACWKSGAASPGLMDCCWKRGSFSCTS